MLETGITGIKTVNMKTFVIYLSRWLFLDGNLQIHVSTNAAVLCCIALNVALPQNLDILKKKPDLL
jgi:hypothetical protein